MQSFEFYAPTQIVFGPNTQLQTAHQIQAHGGSRVLVVYGGQSAVKSGLLDQILNDLRQSDLPYEILGGVRPNPHLELAREGVLKALAFHADFILAVGGGSVIDTAKAIADGAANPEVDIWDFWLRKVPLTTALPVGVVLTISAAGSECSDSAVLTRDDTLEKRGLSSVFHRPRFAIMNPELTFTLPKYQISCGIVDIMMHTLDRYFNPVTNNELTDEIAQGLLRCTIKNGHQALAQENDYQSMSELMWAGTISHNGLTGLGNRQDFAPHQLGHELSAKFDVAHGASLSAIWDGWARYCVDANPGRFAQYGVQVWGLDPTGKEKKELALDAIDATADYFRSIGMPTCLSELGCGILSEEVLDDLAFRCTFRGARTIGTFKVLDQQDILTIYRMANH